MSPPVVAIVGRPNVGKSTLFNALVGRRISIVEPTSGVTRDRVSAMLRDADGAALELVDMGGMGAADLDVLGDRVEEQIRAAIERADVLVFVVDGREGLLPQDRRIADRVRGLDKPVILVANKVESARAEATAAEAYELGLGEPLLLSALQRSGTGDLRDRLFEAVAGKAGSEAERPELRLAIVGRRNVGKSTFINALAEENRVIVSEVPGTTRDSVDVRFELDGKVFVAMDTAGLRKKKQIADAVEFYSLVRARESVRRADVVLFLFDVSRAVTRVDKKLARYVTEQYKPCVIVVNKWDLATDQSTEEFVGYFESQLPGLRRAPICFTSALSGRHVRSTVDVARALWKQARTRVGTAQLNEAIDELRRRVQRATRAARRPKLYYATQVGTAPPDIVLFVNAPESFSPSARRFVDNFLHERLPFPEVPVRIRYRRAGGDEREPPGKRRDGVRA
jgi:GTP-binding protein